MKLSLGKEKIVTTKTKGHQIATEEILHGFVYLYVLPTRHRRVEGLS